MLAVFCASGAPAATAPVVVSVSVPSATTLNTSACASGVAGRTDFGSMLPGTSAVTSSDCTITFGSSNDTSSLRIGQSDGLGAGMWQPTRGALDASFDTDGRVSTATAPGTGNDTAYAVAAADDKVVIAGDCDMGGATAWDMCLSRYDSAGQLDTTFDGDGRVTTAIAGGTGRDTVYGMVIQSDGKIVVAGTCDLAGATGWDVCLARYNTNGSLDTSFDTDGRVTTDTSGNSDYALATTLQADGKIVTVGYCYMGVGTGWDACVMRYNANGALDTTFGGDGRVTTAIAPGAGGDYLYALAVQPNGSIVAAGYCEMGGGTGEDVCLVRYGTDGALDTSFDTDGRVTLATAPGAGQDIAYAVALQPDGAIVVGGQCDMAGATGIDACIIRLSGTGTLDSSFDGDGRVTTATGPGTQTDNSSAVTVQPDGKIVAAGLCSMGGATSIDFCLARYGTDGSLDSTFDGDGRVTTAIAPGASNDRSWALAWTPDGDLVAAGDCAMGGATGRDACLAKYDDAGSLSQYQNAVTDWDTASTSAFGACLRSVGSATATWTANATCPQTDGAYWNAIPATATAIATAASGQAVATANLRFGLRAAASQAPGTYVAPVTFTVTAP